MITKKSTGNGVLCRSRLALLGALLVSFSVLGGEADDARTVRLGPGLASVTVGKATVIAIPEAINPHRQAPFRVDDNAPSLWIGQQFVLFHSWENIWRATGPGLAYLNRDELTHFDNPKIDFLWIWLEAAYLRNGTIYGFYHQEIPNVCPPRAGAAAPGYPVLAKIGGVRSRDEGHTWEDLGWIMEGRSEDTRCLSGSPWYAGGTGDFGVVESPDQQYLYFYFANYSPDPEEQGIALARLAAADLDRPVGQVHRWFRGGWAEPGLGGHSTTVFRSTVDIYRRDGQTFWGPVIHWNTYLRKYVMVLNRTRDAAWSTEGIYLSVADRADDASAWSKPVRILDRAEATRGDASKPHWNGWYASLTGTAPGETDKQGSQSMRLFIDGVSRWTLTFQQP